MVDRKREMRMREMREDGEKDGGIKILTAGLDMRGVNWKSGVS